MKKIIIFIAIIIIIAFLVVCNNLFGNITLKGDDSLALNNDGRIEHPIPRDDKETLANEVNTDIPIIEIVRGETEKVDVEVKITNNSDYLRDYTLEVVKHEGDIPCEDIEVYANDLYIGDLFTPSNNNESFAIAFHVAPHLEKAKLSFRLKGTSTGNIAKIKVKYYSYGFYYYDYNIAYYVKETD